MYNYVLQQEAEANQGKALSFMHQPNATKVVFMDFDSIHEILDSMEQDTSLDTKARPIKGLVTTADSLTFREIH